MASRQLPLIGFLTALVACLLLARQQNVTRYSTDLRQKAFAQLRPSTARKQPACQDNPWNAPGYLNVSMETISENRWVPWDSDCVTPDLFSAVVKREPIPWMQNRTVVLFGSSVDRQHLEYFCTWSQGDKVIALPGHPLAPPPVVPLKEGITVGSSTQPTYCYLKEYDFMIVSSFHYGVDVEAHWRQHWEPLGHFTPPALTEERLENFLLSFLRILNRPTIDLIELSSYEWDLVLALHKSTSHQANEFAQYLWIAQNFMPFFQRRIAEIATRVLEAFEGRTNNYPILFRLPHLMGRDHPAPLVGSMMSSATEYVFSKEEWAGKVQLDVSGKMVLGGEHIGFFNDVTHPSCRPLGFVWFDLMLWHLRKAVTSE